MATTTLPEPPTRRTPRRRRTALLVLLAALVLGGVLGAVGATSRSAPPGAPPPLVDSVGRVDGSTALVAVLARGDQVSAYVCDGDAATGERFSGTLLGDRAVLHSDGGAQLTVDVTDGSTTGTFTPAGAATALPYRTVPSTGTAGWYAAEAAGTDGPVTANWVVLADGTQTGLENSHDHKHKHRGHKLHIKPGKPSGVSPKPGEGSGLIEGEPGTGIKEEVRGPTGLVEGEPGTGIKEELSGCIRNEDGVCVVRGSIDPVVLDGGTTALPSRVLGGGDPEAPLSGDPRSLAGA